MTAAEVREVLEVLGETFGATADGLIAEIVRASIVRNVVFLVFGTAVIIAFSVCFLRKIKKYGGVVNLLEAIFVDTDVSEIPFCVFAGLTFVLLVAWLPTLIDLIRWLISPRGEAILFIINNMGG